MRIQFNYHVLNQEANLYFQVRFLLPCSLATSDEKHLHNQLGNLPLLPLEQFFLTRALFGAPIGLARSQFMPLVYDRIESLIPS